MTSSSVDDHAIPVLRAKGFPLQKVAVYGPVKSRRFGSSLGINPLTTTYKFCSFDCVYCQYGLTPRFEKETPAANDKLKPAAELIAEIENNFRELSAKKIKIDTITIAGNGEPTLHPEFPEFVKGLLKLRSQYFFRTPIGILSNSFECHRPEIRQALALLNERYMKLDGGDAKTIVEINRPRGNFDFQRLLVSLQDLRNITIQTMFIQGSVSNITPEQVDGWIKAVGFISPKAVQIYTIDRVPADSSIQAVEMTKLHEIAELCQWRTAVETEVFG